MGHSEKYEKLMKNHKKTKSMLESIEGELKEGFLDYYKVKYPVKFAALSKFIGQEIKKISFVEYQGGDGQWADVVLIHIPSSRENNDTVIRPYVVCRGDNNWDFYEDDEAIEVDDIEDREIQLIFNDIQEIYPYNCVEQL
ncbi:MAG: hypothetical protein ACYCSQ_00295 [bacterium]